MADTRQLPEIAVSRTSSQGSSKKSNKSPLPKPPLPRVSTDHHFSPSWKQHRKHTESWKKFHSAADSGPTWRMKWTDDCFQNGRVLIIDYKTNQATAAEGGRPHSTVAAQEIQSLPELRHCYSDSNRVHGAALRVIHVQNAPWATLFLLKKFNIDHPNELVGMPGFSKWARYEKPRQRNGKPFPNGRSWRGQMDPWRNIARTAFGLDYLKTFPTTPPAKRKQQTVFGTKPVDAKMMHLNAYEDGHSPYGYDVSVQRLSVYIQRNLGPPQKVSPDIDVKNPYIKHFPNGGLHGPTHHEEERVALESFDNSNTVIVFETSASMMLDDCLVQPRNDFEKRWRRLSFYLRKEDVLNDAMLAAQCTNFILTDVFHGLRVVWDQFLSVASDHVAILEDKIYENPADESRAPELWTNQAAWLKVDKIMYIHTDLLRELRGYLRDLEEADDEVHDEIEWMSSTPVEYDRLAHIISEDLVQPTNNLSDLMYKSVGIRDSRQSLQLGLSMWRLSWITFIFLPLTFIVGFFGMNVSLFEDFPDIGWYFVGAAILMLIVLILWYCIKHSLQRKRQTPYQRGLYENLFTGLEEQYPDIWTSNGAAQDLEPVGFIDRIKWRLLKRWFSPEKTINKRLYSSLSEDEPSSELGAWASFKRNLLIRWLPGIKLAKVVNDPIELAEAGETSISNDHEETVAINELAKYSTPVAMADAVPTAVAPMSTYGLRPLTPVERRQSTTSDRSSSRGSSGIMYEERNLSDSESDAGEGASNQGRRRESR